MSKLYRKNYFFKTSKKLSLNLNHKNSLPKNKLTGVENEQI